MNRSKKGMYGAGFLVFALLMLCATAVGWSDPVAAASMRRAKSRTIHVVYDDSGSMAGGTNTSWSQARYALEVFAAMMSENDEMTVYPMSSFSYVDKEGTEKSSTWGDTVTISGSTSADQRIAAIDKLNGTKEGWYLNTPLESVGAAGDALLSINTDDKWLVILTDGSFDHGTGNTSKAKKKEVRKKILSYAGNAGAKVAYVAISESGTDPNDLKDKASDTFLHFSASKTDILSTVTQVARTVYNLQTISLSGDQKKVLKPDIPVSKVIVFAQGENVSIGEMEVNGSGINVSASSVEAQVPKDTPSKPTNCGEVTVADGLRGTVTTYTAPDEDHPFPAGEYSFTCNTSDVEVYFEPGVNVVAELVDESGDVCDLSQDNAVLTAGNKTVRLRIINPLTGEEIDPGQSPLLKGVQMSMEITDSSGESVSCKDGDAVELQTGDLEIKTKAVFEGDLEKTSSVKNFHVDVAGMQVSFSQPKGYELDVTSLKTSEPIRFSVMNGEGQPLSDAEYASLQVSVEGPPGLNWEYQYMGNGEYELTPSYAGEDGMAAVDLENGKLAVTVSTQGEGIPRTGSAECSLMGAGQINLGLVLTLETPPETQWAESDKKKYMFDSSTLGAQDGAPFLLVRAEVENADGERRPMTDAEWNAGVGGFKFSSRGLPEPMPARILWKIVDIVCVQKLDFEVVPGEEPSTYKLYPTGLTPVNVRPNQSELDIELNVPVTKSITESGKTSGVVSVKPQHILKYIGWLLAALAALILLGIFAFLELVVKKRFDRDLYPNTQAHLDRAGVPYKPPVLMVSGDKRVENRFWPPTKAESSRVKMEFGTYVTPPIYFHIEATGRGTFKITDLQTAFAPVAATVKFNAKTYAAAVNNPPVFDRNSRIKIAVNRGTTSGYVYMTFVKPDLTAAAKGKGKKK